MSMQSDLRNPELGYHDEGLNLADASVFARACQGFGQATKLPPVAYRSKAFAELENEKVWTRSWVAIGLLQQIPNPGDLLPFTLGFHGIHVQRNADDSISARLNRHQHGGCRFVPEQCRTGAQTKCSIASCNYTRDSDVMPAGENGENTDPMYKFVGLVPERLAQIRCETWGPFIFVNLDPDCLPLEDYLGRLPVEFPRELLQSHPLIDKIWLDFASNWKLAGTAFTGICKSPEVENAGPSGENFGSIVTPGTAISGARQYFWLFPNVLLRLTEQVVGVVLLQATGMGKTLQRSFLLKTGNHAMKEEDACREEWHAFLRERGAVAEDMHKDAVSVGTSSRPGTSADCMPLESNPCSYALHQFLAAKLQVEHHYHWNAPILDAAMMMRRT